ncbi:hypothetical protein OEZ85_011249 [Tetradesmus obliquus]|uniref:TF-B3 domain-containing protein n=1 Tax=Tetradesmus obliquus TaxID=3088 RepID=A0ABY8TQ50_TETOB|nr:hypothetical protein OEZ85_011249 [Tetradesmus obliquus]
MVESHFLELGSGAANCLGATSLRKRKASNSSFLDQEFLSFLKESGVLNSCDEDPSIAELFRGAPGQQQQGLCGPEAMNDLPGVFSFQKTQQPAAEPIPSDTRDTVASQVSGLSSPQLQQQAHQACSSAFAQQQPLQHLSTQQPRFHRAVITSMPMPAPSTRAAAAAAPDDDDTNSAATMPMPSKRRRTDDDEVTSSPNDLVELPSSTVVTTASGTAAAAATATSRGARTSDAAPVPDQQQRSAAAAAAAAASSSKSAAAAESGIVKAILVAKVLTKSDANSKRIILPRIAVEANLPQLAHAQVFNLSATDPHGASWPLVIKAWANGANPKPVYVLEQVGEMLKQYKLTTGDAVAVMASEDGRFWLEWNTPAAKAAAARPTYSAFTFKNVQQQQQPAAAAKPAPAAPVRSSGGKGAVIAAAEAAAAAAPEQPSAAQQQQQQQQPAAVKVEPVTTPAQQPPALKLAVQQPAVQQQQQPTASKQQQQPSCSTVMTAVPVTSDRLIPGTFMPQSPCSLLVMHADAANTCTMQLDDPQAMMLKSRSDALFELQDLPAAAAVAGNAPEGEALLVPVVPEAGENGALHAGGFLLCPRTAGCTRPAGHQGWCLGHKGYKKRRV